MQIIYGAYTSDRDLILHHSHRINFLTGEENKEMLNAHNTGVMIVGEPFRHTDGLYDFGSADFTKSVMEILPTMSKYRLTPPPKEVYSLHKKVVGTYLICIKLNAKVAARQIFEKTYANWLEDVASRKSKILDDHRDMPA
eukprot:CAMPEP_0116875472 /NCGR_PEP_ID=MMETSP0463-20121206/7443_1 /TAXON_ID=181622 /ORGANISM="Strombidinopsis sp, Strain SopsisLIS2011" /LENGTH=139 /DNA_ID=CAMNT_0004521169 /DNA_START=1415 /DNA_END=1830 /DNA_ORIENTATION=+